MYYHGISRWDCRDIETTLRNVVLERDLDSKTGIISTKFECATIEPSNSFD